MTPGASHCFLARPGRNVCGRGELQTGQLTNCVLGKGWMGLLCVIWLWSVWVVLLPLYLSTPPRGTFWGRTFGLCPVRHRVSGVGAIASLFPVPSSSPNLPTRRFPRFEMSLRLSCGLKALSRLTNWEAAASRRAQMRPTPDACRDLSELLGHPQRCAPSPYFS
jgi:hypothetical protein